MNHGGAIVCGLLASAVTPSCAQPEALAHPAVVAGAALAPPIRQIHADLPCGEVTDLYRLPPDHGGGIAVVGTSGLCILDADNVHEIERTARYNLGPDRSGFGQYRVMEIGSPPQPCVVFVRHDSGRQDVRVLSLSGVELKSFLVAPDPSSSYRSEIEYVLPIRMKPDGEEADIGALLLVLRGGLARIYTADGELIRSLELPKMNDPGLTSFEVSQGARAGSLVYASDTDIIIVDREGNRVSSSTAPDGEGWIGLIAEITSARTEARSEADEIVRMRVLVSYPRLFGAYYDSWNYLLECKPDGSMTWTRMTEAEMLRSMGQTGVPFRPRGWDRDITIHAVAQSFQGEGPGLVGRGLRVTGWDATTEPSREPEFSYFLQAPGAARGGRTLGDGDALKMPSEDGDQVLLAWGNALWLLGGDAPGQDAGGANDTGEEHLTQPPIPSAP